MTENNFKSPCEENFPDFPARLKELKDCVDLYVQIRDDGLSARKQLAQQLSDLLDHPFQSTDPNVPYSYYLRTEFMGGALVSAKDFWSLSKFLFDQMGQRGISLVAGLWSKPALFEEMCNNNQIPMDAVWDIIHTFSREQKNAFLAQDNVISTLTHPHHYKIQKSQQGMQMNEITALQVKACQRRFEDIIVMINEAEPEQALKILSAPYVLSCILSVPLVNMHVLGVLENKWRAWDGQQKIEFLNKMFSLCDIISIQNEVYWAFNAHGTDSFDSSEGDNPGHLAGDDRDFEQIVISLTSFSDSIRNFVLSQNTQIITQFVTTMSVVMKQQEEHKIPKSPPVYSASLDWLLQFFDQMHPADVKTVLASWPEFLSNFSFLAGPNTTDESSPRQYSSLFKDAQKLYFLYCPSQSVPASDPQGPQPPGLQGGP
jgi:hypothetical protein